MSGNKFSGFFEARREEPQQSTDPLPAPVTPATETPMVNPTVQRSLASASRGRPATGKRSNPDYQQVSCFVRKETYQEAQVELLRQGKKQDFSDLVDDLVSQWLQKR